ncbi:MAG: hypothetical protein ACYC5K_13055 [Saccharofermentanales bacterium]
MKRRERALIIFPVLVFIWGTILSGPFRCFSWMTRDLGEFALRKLGAGSNLVILLAYLFSILVMIGLFFIRRNGNRSIIPAICSIASAVFYFIKSSFSDSIPVYIAVGLVLSLFAYAVNSRLLEEWLTDLFILGIPVMMIYDTLLVPLFVSFKLDTGLFYPWIDIPDNSLMMGITLLQLPVLVWGGVITLLAVVPAVYFVSSDPRKRK